MPKGTRITQGSMASQSYLILFQDQHLPCLAEGGSAEFVEINPAAAGIAIGISSIPIDNVGAFSHIVARHHLSSKVEDGKSAALAGFDIHLNFGIGVCFEGVGISVFQLAYIGIHGGNFSLNVYIYRSKELAGGKIHAFQPIVVAMTYLHFIVCDAVALLHTGIGGGNHHGRDQYGTALEAAFVAVKAEAHLVGLRLGGPFYLHVVCGRHGGGKATQLHRCGGDVFADDLKLV